MLFIQPTLFLVKSRWSHQCFPCLNLEHHNFSCLYRHCPVVLQGFLVASRRLKPGIQAPASCASSPLKRVPPKSSASNAPMWRRRWQNWFIMWAAWPFQPLLVDDWDYTSQYIGDYNHLWWSNVKNHGWFCSQGSTAPIVISSDTEMVYHPNETAVWGLLIEVWRDRTGCKWLLSKGSIDSINGVSL